MRKTLERRCVELTQTALARYMQQDVEYALSLCDESVMLIAPEQGRYVRGIEGVREDFLRSKKVLSPSHISQSQFEVVQNCGDACTVVGRYLVTTDETVESFLQVQQRCQFTWERRSGDLRLMCINVSNPVGEFAVSGGKVLASSVGKMAQRYIEARIAAQNDKRRLVFTEVGGPIRFIALNEVVWVGARRKHTVVHTVSGDFEAGIGLSEVAKSLGDGFVSVHRSYIVNPGYVASIERNEVVMTDETRVPVPEKRRAEVVRRLMGSVS